jgi:hypothetical protein
VDTKPEQINIFNNPPRGRTPGNRMAQSQLSELMNPAPLMNPPAINPPAMNPPAVNPIAMNPAAMNPAAMNPAAMNPAAVNPATMNPIAMNPAAMNPVAMNPAAMNPAAMMHSLYGLYTNPFGWFPQPAGYLPPGAQMPFPSQPAAAPPSVDYPVISDWLKYCDDHPKRRGDNLMAHAAKFSEDGFRTINQLVSERVTINSLSEWLHIGHGTADLLIRYATEDCDLVRCGQFRMGG